MNPIIGVNLANLTNVDAICEAAAALPFRVTFAVVCDPDTRPIDYLPGVKKLAKVGDVMLRIVDSFAMLTDDRKRERYTVTAYAQRFQKFLMMLAPFVKYVEAGNEVNGNWLGRSVANKVREAIRVIRSYNLIVVVTYYLDADNPKQMYNWAAMYQLQADITLISTYPRTASKMPDWDSAFLALHQIFPNQKLGFGEFGLEDADGNKEVSDDVKRALIVEIYAYAPLHDFAAVFVVGGFYWDSADDFAILFAALLDLRKANKL